MAGKCPYCETKVKESEQQVRCPDCGTIYHYTCWRYFVEKCKICSLENEDYQEAKRKAEERKNAERAERKIIQAQAKQETNTAKEYVNTTKEYISGGVNYAQENINNTLNNEETGMFANVGEKLKGWAKANFVLGVIFGIITAIAMMVIGEEFIIPGILSGVMEIAAAWAFSLILYAFGEVVSNSKESKKLQQQILDELKNKKE